MSNKHRFELMMEALVELAPEISSAVSEEENPLPPTVNETFSYLNQLPNDTLFLGMADDELPVLLNMFDSVPGPILISGDAGSGKTTFLKMIAEASSIMHSPSVVQYGVITPFPNEWQGFETSKHCAGIFPIYEKSSMDFVISLSAWAHGNKSKQVVLLLLDDLYRINQSEFETKNDLRWLFMRGPSKRVWPIVTVNSEKMIEVEPWLDLFRTRIFGAVNNASLGETITNSDRAELHKLAPGIEFTMRERSDWLRFWVPRPNNGDKNGTGNALVRQQSKDIFGR